MCVAGDSQRNEAAQAYLSLEDHEWVPYVRHRGICIVGFWFPFDHIVTGICFVAVFPGFLHEHW